jgi:hypothetical protein
MKTNLTKIDAKFMVAILFVYFKNSLAFDFLIIKYHYIGAHPIEG